MDSKTARERPFGLPASARLRTQREFRRVYGRGRRARGQWLVVVAFQRRSPGHRLGLSVSKEHGPAVRRNKIKRLCREAFRLERPTLPGQFDLVLIPQPLSGKYALADLRVELRRLLTELDRGGRGSRPPRGRGRS
jgi:ribonuclease P protein component